MKSNSSKQTTTAGHICHRTSKRKISHLRRKFVIPYEDVLGLEIDILDTYQRPETFTKKKDESGPAGLICRSQVARVAACRLQVGPADRVRQHGHSEYSEGSYTSGSDEKTRLEISFHQPNKNMNILIQSDIYLQMAANGGIRENYHQQRQDIDHGSGGVLPRSQKPANSTPSTALC